MAKFVEVDVRVEELEEGPSAMLSNKGKEMKGRQNQMPCYLSGHSDGSRIRSSCSR